MIDIHSHILPGVDDGAKTEEDSIEMAKVAVEEGVTKIVATPHHKNRHFENYKDEIASNVKVLNALFEENGIPLEVVPGQEVRIYGEVLEDYRNGEIQSINDTDYVLIEFPYSSVPQFAEQLLYDMQVNGLRPIIVHPERNRELMENHDRLYELVMNGALTQITAASIIGRFGKKIAQFTHQIIEAQLTHFIASDAHNTTTRGFYLQDAYTFVKDKFGVDTYYLFYENGNLLIDNKNVNRLEPRKVRQRRKLFGLF